MGEENLSQIQDTGSAAPGDSQAGMADDFFSGEKFELVDDDGNKIEKPEEPETKEKPTQKTEGKPVATKTEKESAELPVGFEQRFFTKGEKGDVAFNHEAALDFLLPKKESKTAFSYKPPKLADAPLEKKEEDIRPEWQKRLESKQTFTKGLREQMMAWRKHYVESLNGGLDHNSASAVADQRLNEHLEGELEKYNWSLEAEREKQADERAQQKMQELQYRQNARSNELSFYQEAGGEEAYNEIMFGRMDEKGKYVPGVATYFINQLYDIANQSNGPMTREQRSADLQSWWQRFTGDPERGYNHLAFVYNLAKMSLMQKYFPQYVKQISSKKEKEMLHNKAGSQGKPSGLQSATKTTKTNDAWSRYLSGPMVGET